MKDIKNEYVKRTQKDYSISFKLSVVSEIERGEISVTGAQKKYGVQGDRTITNWLRKYGNFDWENQPGITSLLQILALLSGRSQASGIQR